MSTTPHTHHPAPPPPHEEGAPAAVASAGPHAPSPLEPVCPDIWRAPYDVFMPGGVHFPTHTAVLRVGGGLLLYSPGPVSDALAEALAELGPVRWLVAPNAFHHLHVAAAHARYPQAEVWVPPGLSTRAGVALPPHRVIGERSPAHDAASEGPRPASWDGVLDVAMIRGAHGIGRQLDELCLWHRPTATLVVCDLVFNLHRWRGWQMSMVLRMAGAHKRLAQSRLWRLATTDRAAAAQSVHRVLRWPCRRVVPCHGEVVSGAETHRRLRDALGWMRGTAALPAPASGEVDTPEAHMPDSA